jgi:cell fate regulator YaaT (PSP1 superfamily)
VGDASPSSLGPLHPNPLMSHLIEVAFKGNRKEFFLWEADEPPRIKAPVIVDADRGEDLGHVHALDDLAEKRSRGAAHGLGDAAPSKRVRRVASSDDVRRFREVREQDEDARRKAMERVKANDLVMKISDAEWQWDRKKLTFYFTAEKRVDFRNLVRELAAMFRTRIELKQIGVRDEAKRLDGIGRCGRQYCSSSWLPELRPVNLGVAKDQRLSLNPSQISGACGRLMCCLRYEHEFYVQQRKRFPKEGRLVPTSRGDEKVIGNDIFRERVTLRGGDGEIRVVPLAELRGELETSGAGLLVMPSAVEEPEVVDQRGEIEEEAELSPGMDAIVDDENEDAPASAASESDDSTTPTESGSTATEARKPHRRRGRRGGRRNRAGRERGDTGDGGSSSSSGA